MSLQVILLECGPFDAFGDRLPTHRVAKRDQMFRPGQEGVLTVRGDVKDVDALAGSRAHFDVAAAVPLAECPHLIFNVDCRYSPAAQLRRYLKHSQSYVLICSWSPVDEIGEGMRALQRVVSIV